MVLVCFLATPNSFNIEKRISIYLTTGEHTSGILSLNLYTEQEITQILEKDFKILKIERKIPKKGEFPYNKLILIARKK